MVLVLIAILISVIKFEEQLCGFIIIITVRKSERKSDPLYLYQGIKKLLPMIHKLYFRIFGCQGGGGGGGKWQF